MWRMYGVLSGSAAGYSINEFEVYGSVSASQWSRTCAAGVTGIVKIRLTLHWSGNGSTNFTVPIQNGFIFQLEHYIN